MLSATLLKVFIPLFLLSLRPTSSFQTNPKPTAVMRRSFMLMRSLPSQNRPWQLARQSKVTMPCIILVCPFLDENVGSVSRIMLNWGLSELRIVNPQCDILSERARTLAVGSLELLENAKIYPSLRDCVKDLERVVATTARTRDMTQKMLTPAAAAVEAIDLCCRESICSEFEASANSTTPAAAAVATEVSPPIGIVFGRERGGLMNDELALCDSTIYIPAFEHYEVLNLAQAVNIIGYELWQRNLVLRDRKGNRLLSSSAAVAAGDAIIPVAATGSGSSSSSTTVTAAVTAITDVESLPSATEKVVVTAGAGTLRARAGDKIAKRAELDTFLKRLEDALFERGYEPISRNNRSKAPEWVNIRPIDRSSRVKVDSTVLQDSSEGEAVQLGEQSGEANSGRISTDDSSRVSSDEKVSEDEIAWRELSMRSLQTIFQRTGVTSREVQVLHGMITSLLRLPLKSGNQK